MGIDANQVVEAGSALGLWGRIGKLFAGVAKVAVKVANWASSHPEVVSAIQQVAVTALAAAKGQEQ